MRIRLKAPQGLTTTGIYGADGKEVEVGTEIDVKDAPEGWAGRYDVIGDTEGKETATGEDEKGYAVKKKGGGYYVITLDGEPVSKSLKKDDIEGFDDLSEEDKAAFAELHKAD